jgi:hypothetical protein
MDIFPYHKERPIWLVEYYTTLGISYIIHTFLLETNAIMEIIAKS